MLAINTAFATANLALEVKSEHGEKVVLRDIEAKSKHSELLLQVIEQMCEEEEIDVLDVGTIGVVVGPGSFTGLRIGTAVAKALGCVNPNLKFLALSSLELMAYIADKTDSCKEEFVCALNALSDLYFVAYFDKNGIKLGEEQMIGKDEFEKITLPIFALKGDLDCDRCQEIEISCRDFLDFALEQEKQGKFVTEQELLPVYLRLSQAEANLLKKGKKD